MHVLSGTSHLKWRAGKAGMGEPAGSRCIYVKRWDMEGKGARYRQRAWCEAGVFFGDTSGKCFWKDRCEGDKISLAREKYG